MSVSQSIINKQENSLRESSGLYKKKKKKKSKLFIQIKNILEKYNVVKAGIFGSYARGEQKRGSDIDILIDVKAERFSLLDMAEIKMELERELKRKVDLLTYPSINPHLKEYILADEVKII